MGSAADSTPFDLWGSRDWCNQEVVGESFRLESLQRLIGPSTGQFEEVRTVALLVPEPENKHDPAAVAVRVGADLVGYLPRDVAARYGQVLGGLSERGRVARVACRVRGGLVTDFETNRAGRYVEKERFTASVTVALAEPHLCTPVNEVPGRPHLMLPDGAAIQISGEDQCMPAIELLLRPEGEGYAYATLHEIAGGSGRAAKELVEVRLDGLRVGQLTPKMSGDLLPAVRHLGDLGLVAAAKAKLKGNRLKAEITLHCAKAHELSADWPGNIEHLSPASTPSMSSGQPRAGVAPESAVTVSTGAMPVAEKPVAVGVTDHEPVPPRPTRIRFAPAPGWPPPPDGWEPPAGWRPDPQWPVAPPGWQYWIAE